MPDTLTSEQLDPSPKAWDVLCWRFDELRKAGYTPEDAAVLAESSADLHIACELLANGATADQAILILL